MKENDNKFGCAIVLCCLLLVAVIKITGCDVWLDSLAIVHE